MLRQHLPSSHKERNDGECIRHIKEDSASGNIRPKSNTRSKVQKTKSDVEEVRKQDGANRDVQARLDAGEEVVEDNTLVSSHGIEQTACACGACVGTVDEADAEHEGQDSRGGTALGCLVDHFDDGEAGGGAEDGFGIGEAEEHDEDEGAPTKLC